MAHVAKETANGPAALSPPDPAVIDAQETADIALLSAAALSAPGKREGRTAYDEAAESGAIAAQECPPFVGLANQGGTCYLNALLQALLRTDGLREALLAYRLPPDVAAEDSIPAAVQSLFARMLLSTRRAASSSGLTSAFGWSGSDVHSQQDAQELWRVLADALEASDASLTTALAAFTGQVQDVLICTQCGRLRTRADAFAELCVPIPSPPPLGEGEEVSTHVAKCVAEWAAYETVPGVHCDGCNERTSTMKCTCIAVLPETLMLTLKRFSYDPTTGRSMKINTRVTVPPRLDLSFATVAPGQSPAGPSQPYTLYAVVMHTGGVASGHYFTLVRHGRFWLSMNDGSISSLSLDQVASVLACDAAELEAVACACEAPFAIPAPASSTSTSDRATPYLLLYTRCHRHCTGSSYAEAMGAHLLPESITAAIAADNAAVRDARAVQVARSRIARIHVYHPTTTYAAGVTSASDAPATPSKSFDLSVHRSLSHLFQALGAVPDLNRLRKYDPTTRTARDVFDASDETVAVRSLASLSLTGEVHLLVEVRGHAGVAWPVYDPFALTLTCVVWTSALREHIGRVAAYIAGAVDSPPAGFDISADACTTLVIPAAHGRVTNDALTAAVAATRLALPAVVCEWTLVNGRLPGLQGAAMAPIDAVHALDDGVTAAAADGDCVILRARMCACVGSTCSCDDPRAPLRSIMRVEELISIAVNVCTPPSMDAATASAVVACVHAALAPPSSEGDEADEFVVTVRIKRTESMVQVKVRSGVVGRVRVTYSRTVACRVVCAPRSTTLYSRMLRAWKTWPHTHWTRPQCTCAC